MTRLAQQPYDLMILDLNMPGIIILTGYATVESAIEAVKSDAVDYLLKPVSIEQFVATVERVLRKRLEQHEQQLLHRTIGEAADGLQRRKQTPPDGPQDDTAANVGSDDDS